MSNAEFFEAVDTLRDAAEELERIVEEVAAAMDTLEGIDIDSLSEDMRGAVEFIFNRGVRGALEKIRALEPDRSDPQELKDLAQSLYDACETYAEDDPEDE